MIFKKCSKCGYAIITDDDGVVKIRSRIILIKGFGINGLCKKCGAEFEIPKDIFQKQNNIKYVITKIPHKKS